MSAYIRTNGFLRLTWEQAMSLEFDIVITALFPSPLSPVTPAMTGYSPVCLAGSTIVTPFICAVASDSSR